MAKAANYFVQRNISKNQLLAANIYLAHYFVVSIAWVVAAIIIYFAFLSNLSSDIVGQYLLLRGAIGSLTCTFSKSITPFLKGESRYFVVVIRECVEFLLYISFLVILFTNN